MKNQTQRASLVSFACISLLTLWSRTSFRIDNIGIYIFLKVELSSCANVKRFNLAITSKCARVVYINLSTTVLREALARLFKFSLAFKTLDANARTYGQIIYSSLLNLGEGVGVDAYVKVLDRQSPAVQQRVRDFLYYPMLRVPKEHRREVEQENSRMYPTLFPKGFQFGHDPVFVNQT